VTAIAVIMALIWIAVFVVLFYAIRKPPTEIKNIPRQHRNSVEHKEGGTMSRSDVSDTVLSLLDSGKISWPRSVSERNKFITENLGKVWDALSNINVNANIGLALQDQGEHVSYDEDNSRIAWETLGKVLMLVLVLEDALGIDITALSEADKISLKYGQPTEISAYKAKIRSRVRS